MQNFAARVLTDTKKFDHISPVLRELGWPSIKDQLLVRDTTQVYKIVSSVAPFYLSSKLSIKATRPTQLQHEEKEQSKSPSMQNSYCATVILLSRCKCLELSDRRH